MPHFRYDALDAAGTRRRGSVTARNLAAARESVGRRALFALDVTPAPASRFGQRAVSAEDTAVGFRALSSILGSGLPLDRALDAFAPLAPASWSTALPLIRESVREGKGLARAIGASPLNVPPVVLGLLRAGEGGMGLAAGVRAAAEVMDSTVATRRAVASALSYPIVLALAGGISLFLLVIVVLPRFADILSDIGQPLPAQTRILLGIADFVRASWPLIVLAVAAFVVAWQAWSNTATGRRRLHERLLSVPIAGPIRWSNATSRACGAASSLLNAGVPLMQALPLAGAASGDAAVEERIKLVLAHLRRGEPFGSAVRDTAAFTPTAVRLVQAGEASGNLSEMLAHAASLESTRAQDLLRRAVRVLEPMLIVGFGLVVALVAAGMLQAVYAVRPG